MFVWRCKIIRNNFIKNNKAVSQIIGYVLALQITAVLMTGIILISNDTINRSTEEAAEIIGEDIAQVVSDAVLGAVSTRRTIPDSSYEFTVDIPRTLAGKSYYIELTDKTVFVNSTDGLISVNCTTYNSEEFNYGISGRSYGSNGKIKIFCNKVDDIFKFDFGTPSSNVSRGYIAVKAFAGISDKVWLNGWGYRLPIVLDNSVPDSYREVGITSLDLYNFSYIIYLKPSYFDYSLANENGADLRFYDSYDKPLETRLNHFIETWNPIGVSKIWVNLTGYNNSFLMNTTKTIHMYFGNETAEDVQADPSEFFDFYDDFNDAGGHLGGTSWSEFTTNPEGINVTSDSCLNLTNQEAVYTKDFILERNTESPTITFESPYDFTVDIGEPLDVAINGTRTVYIVYNLYKVEAMMRLKPYDVDSDVILGVLMNVTVQVHGHSTFDNVFENSYVTTSNYNQTCGYTFDKGYPPPISVINGYLAQKNVPIPNNWFLQRTGVFIGNTNTIVKGKNGSTKINEHSQGNYTYIGNSRFNCTIDKYISSFVYLPDVIDTDEAESGDSDENATGPPYLSGKIGIGLTGDDNSYLLVDWVRVYRSLIYDLGINYNGLESNFSYWDDPAYVGSAFTSLNDALFYDYNMGSAQVSFVVENLPEDEDLFVTIGMGSEDIAHDTTITIKDEFSNKISTIYASDDAGSYSICYQAISADSHGSKLIFGFESSDDSVWLVNTLTIEKGDGGIHIEEDL